MKSKTFIFLFLFMLTSTAFSQQAGKDTILVFYLGGQSNMDGFGYNTELPESLNIEFEDVWIFHGDPKPDENLKGGLGKWETLKPGHGTGFSSDGSKNKLSNRFGVELSFAETLKELYPNQKIALIKYSRGGTSLDSLAAWKFGSWEPDYVGENGINQYDHFLNTVNNAFNQKDITGDGKEDYLHPEGIIWMQGESDASYTEEIARGYYGNLKRLMDLIRASFRKGDLPVVIGKISDSYNDSDGKVWDHGDLVQYAQEKYVKSDKNAAIVRATRYFRYSDRYHYDSEGYISLGKEFAKAIYELSSQ